MKVHSDKMNLSAFKFMGMIKGPLAPFGYARIDIIPISLDFISYLLRATSLIYDLPTFHFLIVTFPTMSSETRRRKRPKLPTLQPSHSEPRAGTSNQDQDSNSSWITTIKSTRAATNRNFMSNETLVDHTSPNTASPSQSLSKPLTSSESLPLPVTGNMDTRQTQEVHDSDNVLGKRKRKRARVYTAKVSSTPSSLGHRLITAAVAAYPVAGTS